MPSTQKTKKSPSEVSRLKDLVARANRIVFNEKLADYHGHVSARVPGTRKFMIKPILVPLNLIRASDILVLDLDEYIERQLYIIGTSGSVLEDMKIVLEKVESGKLDTDISVAAICGMAGAVEGIRAVENQIIPGKILVYPACPEMGLVTLDKLSETMPDVAKCLKNGLWNKQAEQTLLANYAQ